MGRLARSKESPHRLPINPRKEMLEPTPLIGPGFSESSGLIVENAREKPQRHAGHWMWEKAREYAKENMNCICADIDNDAPCPSHPVKLYNPELVEHHCYVVRVYRRTSTKKWLYTISKDAMQNYESGSYDSKPDISVGVKL